ncbi:MAG TPA: ABC transporter ATP-binding protein [Gemmatirosa sp.]|nr:ABC transporter ATP-binding protein [Gemmatirosa sp.]
MYARLLRFLRPHAWRMAGAVVCNIGAAAADVFAFTLLIPFLNALFGLAPLGGTGLVDRTLRGVVGALLDPADQMGSLRNLILVILGAVFVKSVLSWLAGNFGASLQEFVTRDLRNATYAHLQRLPLGWYARTKTGQILARVLNDTQQTKQVVTELVTRSLQSTATVLITIAAMVAISWRLTLLALVVAPILIAALQPLLRKLRRGHRRLGDQQGEITAIVQETVSGIRLVKSFGAEAYEERRFRTESDRLARGLTRVARVGFLAQPLTETVGTAIAVAILWIGARQVLVGGTLTGAHLLTFLILVMRMLQPLKQLSQVPTTAQQSLAAAERVFHILDAPTEAALDRGTRAPAVFERALALEHVDFAYPPGAPGEAARPVLRDVSLVARRGEVVALVGASGAGKSTLVDLVPRFHEPTAGRLTLDGVDVREYSLAALRALVGIVSQDTVLFNDTVRRNIAYGADGRFTDAQVEAAARAANAHGFIAELPQGYDTVLGERGTRLSGGQRQRLAIARALLVDPPILILDEATSALDTESERLVQQAIDRLLANRTVFVIAHRLSTVVHAQQILVLERGAVIERGTHAELLARGGAYARLHALQFRDDVVAA